MILYILKDFGNIFIFLLYLCPNFSLSVTFLSSMLYCEDIMLESARQSVDDLILPEFL